MKRFRVIHCQTGEIWEVEASDAENAREVIGWPEEVCVASPFTTGPFAKIIPPKVATQIKPPRPSSSHVCPDCNVSLVEIKGRGEFWWQCPSCDLLYQEWENRYFHADEL